MSKTSKKVATVPKIFPSESPRKTEKFRTHDNFARPFQIEITDKKNVRISTHDAPDSDHYSLFLELEPQRIFIGIDEDKNFRGNSVLLQLETNIYMHIGANIFIWESESPIVDYYSTVGNSDVPYPWAIDDAGRCYLMIEYIEVLASKADHRGAFDAYSNYYKFVGQQLPFKNMTGAVILQRLAGPDGLEKRLVKPRK